MSDAFGAPCPCGSGDGYHLCCGPLHHGERDAETAEELMRSRYAAYAAGEADYLFRTWHPRTRPSPVNVDEGIVWTSLLVTDVAAGGPDDDRGEVAFTARFDNAGHAGILEERSRFERRGGRWVYVDDVGE